jgi:hypothetical protein
MNNNMLFDSPIDLANYEPGVAQWAELQSDPNMPSPWTMIDSLLPPAPSDAIDYLQTLSAFDVSSSASPASTCSSLYSSAPQSPLLIPYLPSSPPSSIDSNGSSRASSPMFNTKTPRTKSSTSSRSGGGDKTCSHCKTTSTPLWRRDPRTREPMCNACGLYLQQRNKLRPQVLIDADAEIEEEVEESVYDSNAPSCTHCQTRKTSVWRRSKDGAQLCNACGVYQRLRGKVFLFLINLYSGLENLTSLFVSFINRTDH